MAYSYSGYGGGGDPNALSGGGNAPIGSADYFSRQLDVLANLAAQRQSAYKKVLQQQQDMINADEQNWMPSAMKGASLGSSFGPWGALIGGIAGTAAGMYSSAKSQHDKGGKSWLEAGARAMFDPSLTFGSERQINRDVSSAMPAAGAMGSAFQKYQQQQKAAATGPATTPPSSDILSGAGNAESLDAINARRQQMGLPPIGQNNNDPYSV